MLEINRRPLAITTKMEARNIQIFSFSKCRAFVFELRLLSISSTLAVNTANVLFNAAFRFEACVPTNICAITWLAMANRGVHHLDR